MSAVNPTTTPAPSLGESRRRLLRWAGGGTALAAAAAWPLDLYQAELIDAVDDLSSQAEDFRTTGPEAGQAFYDGVEDGLGAGS